MIPITCRAPRPSAVPFIRTRLTVHTQELISTLMNSHPIRLLRSVIHWCSIVAIFSLASARANAATSGVQGTVRDPRGDAIEGIGVAVGSTTTITDANGHYLVLTTPGTYLIHSSGAGRPGFVLESVTVTIPEGAILTLHLMVAQVSTSVSGQVQDEAGNPVANLLVDARADVLGKTFFQQTRTAADGSYTLPLPWGTWSIRPNDADSDAKGFAPVAPISEEVQDQPIKLSFTLLRRNAKLAGSVLVADGSPLANAKLELFSNATGSFIRVAGSDGKFSFAVRDGFYRVRLDLSYAAEQGVLGPELEVAVKPGETGKAPLIVRTATQVIRVKVTDPNGGVRGALVVATAKSDDYIYTAQSFTDTDGSYVLPVFDGRWSVKLDCLTLDYPCPDGVVLDLGGKDGSVDFTLHYPEFMSFFGTALTNDGKIRLKFLGEADGTADIYFSTDLQHWSLLDTIGFSGGSAWLDVPIANASGFFRAVGR